MNLAFGSHLPFLTVLILLTSCSSGGSDFETETPSASPQDGLTPTPTQSTPFDTPTIASDTQDASPSPTSAPGNGSDPLVPSARCQASGEHHVSWSDSSHSNDVEPSYDQVFDLKIVRRIDIRMNPSDYETMQAELTELLGEFGTSGSPGGPPGGEPGGGFGTPPGGSPPEAVEACVELNAGDLCTFDINGTALNGQCVDDSGSLTCTPTDAPSGGAPSPGGGDTDLLEEDPSFYPVEVEVEGDVWCQVGFRRKGNSTLVMPWGQGIAKLPFRLDFDEFEDDHPETKNQRYFGFKKLTFGNGSGDQSLIREVLATEIFRDRGIPSARNAFVRVYLDHGDGPEYHGLYTMMEDPDDAMTEHVFGDDGGNLYKPQGDCANLTCFNEDSFKKESNDDEADWSDIQLLISALYASREDPSVWRTNLEAVFDVQTFLHWLAINTTIENWDTYGAMAQNYYLYGVPSANGQLTWFPWDLNLSLAANDRSADIFHTQTSETWPLIRYLLDDEVYLANYTSYLPTALGGAFEIEAFTSRSLELQALIAPYVVGEEGEAEPYTFISNEEAFWDSVSGSGGLIEHVEHRHAVVNAALQ